MNINYKGLLNLLGLQSWFNRVTALETFTININTLETSVSALEDSVAALEAAPAPVVTSLSGNIAATAGTRITFTDDNTQNMDFGIGVFPNWPNGDNMIAFGNYGLVIDDNYWGGPALINNTAYVNVIDGGVNIFAGFGAGSSSLVLSNSLFKLDFTPFAGSGQRVTLETTTAANAGGTQLTTGQSGSAIIRFLSGTVAPESAVSAGLGSLYTRINGAAAELYFKKTSPTATTGWVLVTTA